jgi:hypothetical protein
MCGDFKKNWGAFSSEPRLAEHSTFIGKLATFCGQTYFPSILQKFT